MQTGDVLCCHATPLSNEEVILPDTDRAELERALAVVDAAAVAAGHVHLQWLRRVEGKLWFCVGSVGLVYEATSSARSRSVPAVERVRDRRLTISP